MFGVFLVSIVDERGMRVPACRQAAKSCHGFRRSTVISKECAGAALLLVEADDVSSLVDDETHVHILTAEHEGELPVSMRPSLWPTITIEVGPRAAPRFEPAFMVALPTLDIRDGDRLLHDVTCGKHTFTIRRADGTVEAVEWTDTTDVRA